MKPWRRRIENNSVIVLLQKVWAHRKLLIVEPLLLCWLLPACLLIVTVQNLALEKACRVNLGYNASVCMSMLDKELYGIDCEAAGITEDASETMENSTNVMEGVAVQMDLNATVCRAEIETQKQVTYINAIRGPMSSVFPIIVILFAGGWSDRRGLRKPCMLFPMFGELLAMLGLMITSIFMEVIPMEFGAIIERVVPSMLGGQTLMIMGIYSYLTEITEEKDRAFRFGIFGIAANIIQLVGTPFSGTLHNQLGYVKMTIIAACIQFLGILYLIFFIPEVDRKPKQAETNGNTNAAYEIDGQTIAPLEIDSEKNGTATKSENQVKQKNCLMDFFDPTSAYECIKIFLKKRAHNLRFYLIMLVILQMLFIATAIGEADYYYNFQLIQLKWNGEMFSYFNTYSAALNIVGTFFMTAVLIKFLSLSDSMAGFIATLGTVVSKPFLAFAKDAVLYYIGTTLDMFISCKAIAVKSIISNFVESEELGRLYSVLGITEALGGFIFPPLYSQVYSSTIESFPGAFYIFSEIFLVPTLFMFIATYIYLRKQNKKNAQDAEKNGIDNPAVDENNDIESTRV